MEWQEGLRKAKARIRALEEANEISMEDLEATADFYDRLVKRTRRPPQKRIYRGKGYKIEKIEKK